MIFGKRTIFFTLKPHSVSPLKKMIPYFSADSLDVDRRQKDRVVAGGFHHKAEPA
jgi:hypothetical protein